MKDKLLIVLVGLTGWMLGQLIYDYVWPGPPDPSPIVLQVQDDNGQEYASLAYLGDVVTFPHLGVTVRVIERSEQGTWAEDEAKEAMAAEPGISLVAPESGGRWVVTDIYSKTPEQLGAAISTAMLEAGWKTASYADSLELIAKCVEEHGWRCQSPGCPFYLERDYLVHAPARSCYESRFTRAQEEDPE